METKIDLYRIFGIITHYHETKSSISFFGPLTTPHETGYIVNLRHAYHWETSQKALSKLQQLLESKNDNMITSEIVKTIERHALSSSLRLVQAVLDNKISYTFIKNKFYHQSWPKTNSVTEWDEFYKNMLATITSFVSLTHFTHFMKLRTFQRLGVVDVVNVSFSNDIDCRLAVRISGRVVVFQHDGVNQSNAMHHCQQMLLDHLESTIDSITQEKVRRLLEYSV